MIEILNALNSAIGITKAQLAKQCKLDNRQIEDQLKIITKFSIPLIRHQENKQEFYSLEIPAIGRRFSFNFREMLQLAQPYIYQILPGSARIKLHKYLGTAVLNLLHRNHSSQQSIDFSKHGSYRLLYFSKQSNRYEKRIITPVKELRVGSQFLLEAYCFKRKAIRWFEKGRIKTIILLENYHAIPKTARRYFKEMVIEAKKADLPYLKWAFQDILIAYNQKQVRIEYSEKENILKELSALNSIRILNNHSN